MEVAPDNPAPFDKKRLAMGHAEQKRDAEGFRHRALVIGKEKERQMVLLLEAELRVGFVGADADHADPARLQRLEIVAKAARLRAAAGRVGLRIKINERETVAIKIVQPDIAALFVARDHIR